MYKGQSCGRLIEFLDRMMGCSIAYEVIFDGDHSISYKGEPFATYYWLYDTDVPVFQFVGPDRQSRSEQQSLFFARAALHHVIPSYREHNILEDVEKAEKRADKKRKEEEDRKRRMAWMYGYGDNIATDQFDF